MPQNTFYNNKLCQISLFFCHEPCSGVLRWSFMGRECPHPKRGAPSAPPSPRQTPGFAYATTTHLSNDYTSLYHVTNSYTLFKNNSIAQFQFWLAIEYQKMCENEPRKQLRYIIMKTQQSLT